MSLSLDNRALKKPLDETSGPKLPIIDIQTPDLSLASRIGVIGDRLTLPKNTKHALVHSPTELRSRFGEQAVVVIYDDFNAKLIPLYCNCTLQCQVSHGEYVARIFESHYRGDLTVVRLDFSHGSYVDMLKELAYMVSHREINLVAINLSQFIPIKISHIRCLTGDAELSASNLLERRPQIFARLKELYEMPPSDERFQKIARELFPNDEGKDLKAAIGRLLSTINPICQLTSDGTNVYVCAGDMRESLSFADQKDFVNALALAPHVKVVANGTTSSGVDGESFPVHDSFHNGNTHPETKYGSIDVDGDSKPEFLSEEVNLHPEFSSHLEATILGKKPREVPFTPKISWLTEPTVSEFQCSPDEVSERAMPKIPSISEFAGLYNLKELKELLGSRWVAAKFKLDLSRFSALGEMFVYVCPLSLVEDSSEHSTESELGWRSFLLHLDANGSLQFFHQEVHGSSFSTPQKMAEDLSNETPPSASK